MIIYFIINITNKGNAIYWSERVGKDNNIFHMPKFRTMKINTPQLATHLLKNPKKYYTKLGFFLRKTSLDELPQIYCVLKGEMSLVGPRPALFNQYDLIKLRDKYGISKFRPGVTGWAQVNGRDSLSINEKVIFDKYYIENKSLKFDLYICCLTLIKVLNKAQINQ